MSKIYELLKAAQVPLKQRIILSHLNQFSKRFLSYNSEEGFLNSRKLVWNNSEYFRVGTCYQFSILSASQPSKVPVHLNYIRLFSTRGGKTKLCKCNAFNRTTTEKYHFLAAAPILKKNTKENDLQSAKNKLSTNKKLKQFESKQGIDNTFHGEKSAFNINVITQGGRNVYVALLNKLSLPPVNPIKKSKKHGFVIGDESSKSEQEIKKKSPNKTLVLKNDNNTDHNQIKAEQQSKSINKQNGCEEKLKFTAARNQIDSRIKPETPKNVDKKHETFDRSQLKKYNATYSLHSQENNYQSKSAKVKFLKKHWPELDYNLKKLGEKYSKTAAGLDRSTRSNSMKSQSVTDQNAVRQINEDKLKEFNVKQKVLKFELKRKLAMDIIRQICSTNNNNVKGKPILKQSSLPSKAHKNLNSPENKIKKLPTRDYTVLTLDVNRSIRAVNIPHFVVDKKNVVESSVLTSTKSEKQPRITDKSKSSNGNNAGTNEIVLQIKGSISPQNRDIQSIKINKDCKQKYSSNTSSNSYKETKANGSNGVNNDRTSTRNNFDKISNNCVAVKGAATPESTETFNTPSNNITGQHFNNSTDTLVNKQQIKALPNPHDNQSICRRSLTCNESTTAQKLNINKEITNTLEPRQIEMTQANFSKLVGLISDKLAQSDKEFEKGMGNIRDESPMSNNINSNRSTAEVNDCFVGKPNSPTYNLNKKIPVVTNESKLEKEDNSLASLTLLSKSNSATICEQLTEEIIPLHTKDDQTKLNNWMKKTNNLLIKDCKDTNEATVSFKKPFQRNDKSSIIFLSSDSLIGGHQARGISHMSYFHSIGINNYPELVLNTLDSIGFNEFKLDFRNISLHKYLLPALIQFYYNFSKQNINKENISHNREIVNTNYQQLNCHVTKIYNQLFEKFRHDCLPLCAGIILWSGIGQFSYLQSVTSDVSTIVDKSGKQEEICDKLILTEVAKLYSNRNDNSIQEATENVTKQLCRSFSTKEIEFNQKCGLLNKHSNDTFDTCLPVKLKSKASEENSLIHPSIGGSKFMSSYSKFNNLSKKNADLFVNVKTNAENHSRSFNACNSENHTVFNLENNSVYNMIGRETGKSAVERCEDSINTKEMTSRNGHQAEDIKTMEILERLKIRTITKSSRKGIGIKNKQRSTIFSIIRNRASTSFKELIEFINTSEELLTSSMNLCSKKMIIIDSKLNEKQYEEDNKNSAVLERLTIDSKFGIRGLSDVLVQNNSSINYDPINKYINKFVNRAIPNEEPKKKFSFTKISGNEQNNIVSNPATYFHSDSFNIKDSTNALLPTAEIKSKGSEQKIGSSNAPLANNKIHDKQEFKIDFVNEELEPKTEVKESASEKRSLYTKKEKPLIDGTDKILPNVTKETCSRLINEIENILTNEPQDSSHGTTSTEINNVFSLKANYEIEHKIDEIGDFLKDISSNFSKKTNNIEIESHSTKNLPEVCQKRETIEVLKSTNIVNDIGRNQFESFKELTSFLNLRKKYSFLDITKDGTFKDLMTAINDNKQNKIKEKDNNSFNKNVLGAINANNLDENNRYTIKKEKIDFSEGKIIQKSPIEEMIATIPKNIDCCAKLHHLQELPVITALNLNVLNETKCPTMNTDTFPVSLDQKIKAHATRVNNSYKEKLTKEQVPNKTENFAVGEINIDEILMRKHNMFYKHPIAQESQQKEIEQNDNSGKVKNEVQFGFLQSQELRQNKNHLFNRVSNPNDVAQNQTSSNFQRFKESSLNGTLLKNDMDENEPKNKIKHGQSTRQRANVKPAVQASINSSSLNISIPIDLLTPYKDKLVESKQLELANINTEKLLTSESSKPISSDPKPDSQQIIDKTKSNVNVDRKSLKEKVKQINNEEMKNVQNSSTIKEEISKSETCLNTKPQTRVSKADIEKHSPLMAGGDIQLGIQTRSNKESLVRLQTIKTDEDTNQKDMKLNKSKSESNVINSMSSNNSESKANLTNSVPQENKQLQMLPSNEQAKNNSQKWKVSENVRLYGAGLMNDSLLHGIKDVIADNRQISVTLQSLTINAKNNQGLMTMLRENKYYISKNVSKENRGEDNNDIRKIRATIMSENRKMQNESIKLEQLRSKDKTIEDVEQNEVISENKSSVTSKSDMFEEKHTIGKQTIKHFDKEIKSPLKIQELNEIIGTKLNDDISLKNPHVFEKHYHGINIHNTRIEPVTAQSISGNIYKQRKINVTPEVIKLQITKYRHHKKEQEDIRIKEMSGQRESHKQSQVNDKSEILRFKKENRSVSLKRKSSKNLAALPPQVRPRKKNHPIVKKKLSSNLFGWAIPFTPGNWLKNEVTKKGKNLALTKQSCEPSPSYKSFGIEETPMSSKCYQSLLPKQEIERINYLSLPVNSKTKELTENTQINKPTSDTLRDTPTSPNTKLGQSCKSVITDQPKEKLNNQTTLDDKILDSIKEAKGMVNDSHRDASNIKLNISVYNSLDFGRKPELTSLLGSAVVNVKTRLQKLPSSMSKLMAHTQSQKNWFDISGIVKDKLQQDFTISNFQKKFQKFQKEILQSNDSNIVTVSKLTRNENKLSKTEKKSTNAKTKVQNSNKNIAANTRLKNRTEMLPGSKVFSGSSKLNAGSREKNTTKVSSNIQKNLENKRTRVNKVLNGEANTVSQQQCPHLAYSDLLNKLYVNYKRNPKNVSRRSN